MLFRSDVFVSLSETDYYVRALLAFLSSPAVSTVSEVVVVGFSNDVAFLKQFLPQQVEVVRQRLGWCEKTQRLRCEIREEQAQESDVQNIEAMSACDHHILANSTFSWWAAYLDTKPGVQVYLPQQWYAVGSEEHQKGLQRGFVVPEVGWQVV